MMRARRNRGVILLSVLVVVAIAALVATTAMYLAEGERAGARLAIDRTRARALAWSGVQAALAEASEQREALLTGAAPELTPEWTLFVDESGRRGTVRLVAIGRDGELAVSELAKLDINTATKEMLAKVDGVGEALAAGIVAARAERPFESVEDLARIEGVTAELLYGAPEADGDADEGGGRGGDRAGSGGRAQTRRGASRDVGGESGPSRGPALIDVLTVFAFDANVQAGLGDDGAAHRGKLRINLNTPWSEELGAAVADRFGEDAMRSTEEVFKSGAAFRKDGDIVGKLRELGAPPETWAAFLDAFTTCPDPYVIGRLDLSAVQAEVLACVPGLDEDTAAEIVSARERLDEQSRLDPAWPAAQKIVPPEKWQQAADWTTTRSMVWRVRVESGLLAAEAEEGAELEGRMVVDAVLDVTSERPRVAYLREVTLLPMALAMERRLSSADEAAVERTEEARAVRAADAPSGSPDSIGSEPSPAGRTEEHAEVGPESGDRSDIGGSDPSGGPGGGARPPSSPPPEPKDRRRGRWTTGGKE